MFQTLFNSPPQYVLPHTTHVCMLCGLDFDTPKRKKNCDACGIVSKIYYVITLKLPLFVVLPLTTLIKPSLSNLLSCITEI